ncbi:uncharacterized protein DFL_002402 [Arthrobotrys flagrans]|uniref:Ricin B lectin domain-containing protein n=1 Tax=Arthrobotrys flagrans TaxID=97331 RepID=A0A437ABK5_ARTFL|nr:hypothetical protein DFL_002402 [Arthrobotrys flagrans]
MPESGSTYKIINHKNGTALDLSGTDNVSITGWDSHDGDNQKWILSEEDGLWTIQNVATDKFLAPGGDDQGVDVIGADEAFQWDIRNEGDEEELWRLFVPHSELNVDLDSQGEEEIPAGAKVQLWGQWAGDNQVWKFEGV